MAASALPSTEKRFLTSKSSDGDEFELEESISIKSLKIKKMVEDGCVVGGIPLFKVADRMKHKSLNAVQQIFNIISDFSP
ncbi:SKP1-like protein 1 [Lycium barbarum]|uniref:SKP1-like protein 1 n=1 Tax=Lycium barbarum TaxID=112863 RepID=UPI00293E6F5D|nr:SKP1-like protein 1 [Lycium barbarum]